MSPEKEMFFNQPIVELPKITAPTAAEICAQSKPSPEGRALLTPGMTPAEYQYALEKNNLSLDSVNFLAHGLPEKDATCWACQASRMTAPKLSAPEMDALNSTEAWLKNPTPDSRAAIAASLGKVDFTGPGSWAAQSAMWSQVPGAPPTPAVPGVPAVNLPAAAVAGAILLAAGLNIGPPMPPVPNPKLELPMAPPPPNIPIQLQPPPAQLQLQQPQLPPQPAVPVVNQPKLMKPLLPFIDLGKGVARGTVKCC
jgi:uncharacterized protein DUF6931